MMATKGRPIFGSLWFRLIGAFAVVIGVMLLVVVLVTRGVTERQFDQYLSQRDALFVDILARELTTYYQERGSWDDVEEEVFAAPPPVAVAVEVSVSVAMAVAVWMGGLLAGGGAVPCAGAQVVSQPYSVTAASSARRPPPFSLRIMKRHLHFAMN